MMPSRRLVALLLAALLALLAVGVSAAPFGGSETQRAPHRSSNQQPPPGGAELLPAASGTVKGRVLAAVRPSNAGSWRLEFGFLTESILTSRGGNPSSKDLAVRALVSTAVEANRALLPSSRFLSEATLRNRAQADDRRWLASSLVKIELSSGGSAQGRVIARYNPNDDGDFRVEFGWLPEQARQAAGGNTQAAVAANGAILPRGRYLQEGTILGRPRGDTGEWIFSVPAIEVPVTSPVEPPVVEGVHCLPLGSDSLNPGDDAGMAADSGITVRVAERVECWPTTTGEPPLRYSWSGGGSPPTGNNREFVTAFDSTGRRTVRLTVTNAGGSDRGEAVVLVAQPPTPPQILSLDCQPATPALNATVRCTATASGGAPLRYSWRAPNGSPDTRAAIADGKTFQTTFASPGPQTITVEVTNSAGSDTRPATITVRPPVPPPTITSVTCDPISPRVNQQVTCAAAASGGAPLAYSWSAPNGSPNARAALVDGKTFQTTFGSAGPQTITVEVSNSADRVSRPTSITVLPPVPRPIINAITCAPRTPKVGDDVTCSATLTGGAPDSHMWRAPGGSVQSGAQPTFRTSFTSEGPQPISLTVTNSAGSDTKPATVTVQPELTIERINCLPPSVRVGQTITCTAIVRGSANPSYSWTGGSAQTSDEPRYETSFTSAGQNKVYLIVWSANSGDTATNSAAVMVQRESRPPVIDRVVCEPSKADINEAVACRAELSGGAPETYEWRANGGSPRTGGESNFSTQFSSNGSQTVDLTVRNAAGNDSGSTTVTVGRGTPTCRRIPDQRFYDDVEEVVIALSDYCTDPDGERLRFEARTSRLRTVFVEVGPRWRNDDRNDDDLGMFGNSELGSSTITVTATDPGGLSAETSFEATVLDGGGCSRLDTVIVVLNAPGMRYDLDDYCRGVRYSNLRSADPSIATATLSGSQLTIRFGRLGVTTIRFTITGRSGVPRQKDFEVIVNPSSSRR